jgi:N-acetylglutamate synthase-like GNAT family acetyltransferase
MNTILDLIMLVKGDDRKLEPSQFLVACNNDQVVGCIRTVQAESDCKELASLVVLPQHRNKGLGSNLVQKILDKDKFRPLYLVCFRRTANFYIPHSFQLEEITNLPPTLKRDFTRMTEKKGLDLVAMVLR